MPISLFQRFIHNNDFSIKKLALSIIWNIVLCCPWAIDSLFQDSRILEKVYFELIANSWNTWSIWWDKLQETEIDTKLEYNYRCLEALDWILFETLQVIVWKASAKDLKEMIRNGLIVYILRKSRLLKIDQHNAIFAYLTLIYGIFDILSKEEKFEDIEEIVDIFIEYEFISSQNEGYKVNISNLKQHSNDSISEISKTIFDLFQTLSNINSDKKEFTEFNSHIYNHVN